MNLTGLVTRLGGTAVLLGCALLLWPSLIVFVGVATIGAALGLVVLYVSVDDRDQMRLSWLLAATLLLAYDGGSLSTYLGANSAQDFEILTKSRPIELISEALSLVNILSGLMLIVGRLEHSIVATIAKTSANGRFSYALAIIGLGLIAAGFVFGDLGYMGVQTDEAGRVTVLGAIAGSIEGPMAGVSGFMLARSRRPAARAFHLTVVLLIALAVVPTGRRAIVLLLLVATIGFAVGGGLRRLSPAQKIIGVAVGGVFSYVMGSYFFALRLATWELGNTASLSDQLSLAVEFMFSSSLQDRFSTLLYDNVRERTFVLGYLADLMAAVGSSGPLHGELLIYYFRLIVPSVLDPTKDQILAYQMMEAFVHPKLGLPVIDEANTIVTDGTTDFGLIGAFLYPAALIALLRSAIATIQRLAAPITMAFGTFAVISVILRPELTLDEYLSVLRNLLILLPVMWIAETASASFKVSPRAGGPKDFDNKSADQWQIRTRF